jgi:chaperonin GroES
MPRGKPKPKPKPKPIPRVTFTPLNDQVLIRRLKAEERIGSIIVPESVSEKPNFGTVEAVGPGTVLQSGTFHPSQVKKDQQVAFQKWAGIEIELNKEEFVVIKEEEILGIVEEK